MIELAVSPAESGKTTVEAPAPGSPRKPRDMEDVLLARGMLSRDQLHIARLEQGQSGQALGTLLVELGFLSETALRDAVSESAGTESIDLSQAIADPGALSLVPESFARQHRLLPLAYDQATHRLSLAMVDAHDIIALDRLRRLSGGTLDLHVLIASQSQIEEAIDRFYGYELSIEGILHEIESERGAQRGAADSHGQPVVRLIDALLTDAVKREASDIHFEPERGFLRIRYRIDGMLRQIRVLHQSCWPAMAVRLKVMSGMNIAETRAPQDGHITLALHGRPIDFRASVQPTLHGENIVLRVLDRHKGIVPLEALGLQASQFALLKRMIARPEGLILLTGPTGSGKTTTLYSILQSINTENVNIMTLEDPVEYPLARVRQTSLADAVKLDFASGIRSLMRQDPDILLVGEIRDAETAEMAFRAALTGHQVYSTLHTPSAIGAIPRLRDIGIPPEVMAGNIIGVVAQRLVRRLCPSCRIPRTPGSDERRLLGDLDPGPLIYRPGGCPECSFQGYRGRLPLLEVLRFNDELDELIAERAGLRALRQALERQGFRSLADDGIGRVLDGSTSLAELARVVNLTGRM